MTSLSYIRVNDEVSKEIFYKVIYAYSTLNKALCQDLGLFLTNF